MSDKNISERLSSSVMMMFKFAQLMCFVHNIMSLYYDSHKLKVKAQGVVKQYQRYLQWKDDFLDDLADTDDNDKIIPHVLSLQYCYPCCNVWSDVLTHSAFNTVLP